MAGTNGRVQFLVDVEEIEFLRFFRRKAVDAFGPASDEIIDDIRTEFKQTSRLDLPESEK